MNIKKLSDEFPKESISWRPQGKISSRGSVLALAYIDARDVMQRLDDVCGPENWMDAYVESAKGRVICTLSININGAWVSKSDGAGDTAVEGEKGGLSDAFKRAAVKWGIGRYLYDIDAPWVPCETYGTPPKFSKFSVDPWTCVRGGKPSPAEKTTTAPDTTPDALSAFVARMDKAEALEELATIWKAHASLQKAPAALKAKDRNKARLSEPDPADYLAAG